MDTAEILQRIRKIEITTRNIVNEIFSGEYHSLFKGQGLEFSEVRDYQPGDSYRQIDWNVSARMGHPYIKIFSETRELNVIFVVDCSASTLFGTNQYLKSEFVTEITAVLAFSAITNNDKVGLLLFSDQIEQYIPPRKGKKTALRILREVLYHQPESKGTNLANAVRYLYRLLNKRSIIFILSDFFDKDYDNDLKILAKKHDVVAIQVIDSAELDLPQVGLLHIYDPETDSKFTVNTMNMKVRKEFREKTLAHQAEIINRFKKMRVDLITLETGDNYIKELMKFFKSRIRRRNR
ncbi:MAG: DUF58 domain-containing protein [Candidatus Cloacimonetes bacterium]|nr:DUF58 domain-containing protein [Candidatus Cloacimonadota bacterium]